MLYTSFNYYTVSLLIGAFTALISGFVVIIHDHKRLENQAWFALTMCTAVWSSGYFYMTVAATHDEGFIGNWILHYAAILIPLFYYILVLIITGTLKRYKNKVIAYSVVAFVFISINLTPLFVSDVIPKVGFNYAPVPGPLYIFFFLYFALLVIDGIVTTFFVAMKTEDKAIRARLWYTIIFTIAASVGGGSVFATTFLTVIPPYPIILFSIYPAISGYAILRYQLFDVKVVTAQIFIFTLWIFIFIRTLFSETLQEQLINAVLLLITIGVGLLLNRSVKKEVKAREKIEVLAKDLQSVNDRLRELDKQKTEFISFATHQLRAPLTAIKGYASLILEGDLGPVPQKILEPISRVFESAKTMASVVDDYLNVSRIELGSMKYDFEPLDMEDLVGDVAAELKPNIEKSGLKFSFRVIGEGPWTVSADPDKLKQVIANIIDNSVKYTPTGSLAIALERVPNADGTIPVRFSVTDTGIGIAQGVMPKLFQKFSRADNANKQNIHGTGLGLFIVREIVNAHKGRVWAESAGEGKGSKFIVELPAKANS